MLNQVGKRRTMFFFSCKVLHNNVGGHNEFRYQISSAPTQDFTYNTGASKTQLIEPHSKLVDATHMTPKNTIKKTILNH